MITLDLAVITALYLASYNIGSALGGSVSGAIWTNVLPGALVLVHSLADGLKPRTVERA